MAGLTVGLLAGEASGSALGAGLVEALRASAPDTRCVAVGGDDMAAAGCEILADCEELAVMGIAEVLRHLPRLLRLRRRLKKQFLDLRPDVFIGIDAPDFNLGVERYLKARGVATMHYVSPSVWAWRPGRVKKVARAVDEVLCLLPFEPKFYADHGVAATFVGHPLADRIGSPPAAGPARSALGIAQTARVVAVLPGSRSTEIRALAQPLAAACATLALQYPQLQFVVPVASPALAAPLTAAFASAAPGVAVDFVDGRAQQAMAAADLVILASGTATLEALLLGRPMVVTYRLAAVTHWLLKSFDMLSVGRFSFPNLLADEDLVPELLQAHANAQEIAAAASHLLDDAGARERQLRGFERLRTVLANDASRHAAAAVLARAGAAS